MLKGKGVCMLLQVMNSTLETIHGILSVAAGHTTDRRSNTFSLPEVLRESLPQHVAEFLVCLSLVTFSAMAIF